MAAAQTALPSDVVGPFDLVPLARDAAIRRGEEGGSVDDVVLIATSVSGRGRKSWPGFVMGFGA